MKFMQNLYQETEAIIVRILNCYTNLQRSKHEYCPGVSLYPSEIHAIECIATIKKINLTELANQLGLTKGATSKLVAKLEKEGLLRRYRYVDNQKEIYFHLTDTGIQAYNGHKLYHADMAQRTDASGGGGYEAESHHRGICPVGYPRSKIQEPKIPHIVIAVEEVDLRRVLIGIERVDYRKRSKHHGLHRKSALEERGCDRMILICHHGKGREDIQVDPDAGRIYHGLDAPFASGDECLEEIRDIHDQGKNRRYQQ